MLHWDGKWMLWGLLMVGLLSGCRTEPCISSYQVTVPTLAAPPLPLTCQVGQQDRKCLALLETDYQGLVRELKAACLAAGGSHQQCQTELQVPKEKPLVPALPQSLPELNHP